jgi:ribosome-binding protein aMBF1 (putative translation factor)
MELRDYLHNNRMSCVQLSKEIGVGANYVRNIKLKKVKPSIELATKIELLTGGQVTAQELRSTNGK